MRHFPAVTVFALLVLCPFTKVEESFNLQAIHDLLYIGPFNLTQFDHNEFPGVVPRSFVGACMVSIIISPIKLIADVFQFRTATGEDKLWALFAARTAIAVIVLLPLARMKTEASKLFNKTTATLFTLLLSSQFHINFYASRPLPNTFGLICVLWAFVFWMRRQWGTMIFAFAFATLVFRGDIILLCGPVALTLLLSRQLSFKHFLRWGVLSGVVSLAVSVCVDSFFWQRLLWPEGVGLWFNVYLNKSHQWGTQPFLWYFTSVLPRTLLSCLALLPLGMLSTPAIESICSLLLCRKRSRDDVADSNKGIPWVDWSAVQFVVPLLVFVLLYSFLPHKELRFVIYVVPLLTLVAAHGLNKLQRAIASPALGPPSRWSRAMSTAVTCGPILANAVVGALFAQASFHNYPGGLAARQLHSLARDTSIAAGMSVHVDNLAAQTGFSRFSESSHFRYSKVEGLQRPSEFSTFDFVITENVSLHSDAFEVLGPPIAQFDGGFSFDPVPRARTRPVLWTMRKRASEKVLNAV